MKVKTSELTGPALDWAVAKCEAVQVRWSAPHEQLLVEGYYYSVWQPHKCWATGGPIIERQEIAVVPIMKTVERYWAAGNCPEEEQYGPTPLIAAMRCYVASKLGDEVEVPNDLCGSAA